MNKSQTNLGPSPKYFYINSDPTNLKNVADVSWATAFTNKVLPVPGGPYKITPFGGVIPISSYISGWDNGNSTASLISYIYSSKPPISAYVSLGAFSTFITFNNGLVSSYNTPTTDNQLWCTNTD